MAIKCRINQGDVLFQLLPSIVPNPLRQIMTRNGYRSLRVEPITSHLCTDALILMNLHWDIIQIGNESQMVRQNYNADNG